MNNTEHCKYFTLLKFISEPIEPFVVWDMSVVILPSALPLLAVCGDNHSPLALECDNLPIFVNILPILYQGMAHNLYHMLFKGNKVSCGLMNGKAYV